MDETVRAFMESFLTMKVYELLIIISIAFVGGMWFRGKFK